MIYGCYICWPDFTNWLEIRNVIFLAELVKKKKSEATEFKMYVYQDVCFVLGLKQTIFCTNAGVKKCKRQVKTHSKHMLTLLKCSTMTAVL